MRPRSHGGLLAIPGEGGAPAARTRTGWLSAAGITLVVVAIAAAIVAGLGSRQRALHALPEDQRLALYSRTLADLREFCGDGRPEALRDHCRELASFVVQFAECRGECQELAARQLVSAPTR